MAEFSKPVLLTCFDIDCHLESLGIFLFTRVMYQRLHETVVVAGVYHHSQFEPVWFDWQQKRYQIKQVTLVTDVKDGGVNKRLYSVQAGNDIYRLEFNRDTDDWILKAVWIEG